MRKRQAAYRSVSVWVFRFRMAWILTCALLCLGPVQGLLAQSDTTQDRTVRMRQTATGQQEDVQRYWGYDELNVERYLSLPYDLVMDVNLESFFVQLGILLILFLPWALIGFGKTKSGFGLFVGGLFAFSVLFFVPLAYSSQQEVTVEEAPAHLAEQIAEAREAGNTGEVLALQWRRPLVSLYPGIHHGLSGISGNRDAISYPVLIFLFFLGSVLLQRRLKANGQHEQVMVQSMLYYGLLWWLFSAGIPWYGLLLFPVTLIFSVRGVVGKTWWPAGRMERAGTIAILVIAAWSFAFNGSLRFANYNPQAQSKLPFLLPVVEYQSGAKLEQYAFDRVYLGYQPGIEALNENEYELIYRAGSFMPFFVVKNDQRVFSDNFLDNFQTLYNRNPDKTLLAEALHTYGFSFLIINLRLPSIDQTPDKTLTAKFNRFMDFVTDNPEISLVATDRIVRSGNGSMQFMLDDRNGEVVNPGSFAVLKIGD